MTVPEGQAKELRDSLSRGEFKPSDFVSCGPWSGKVSEIAGLTIREESTLGPTAWDKHAREWDEKVKHLLSLGPRARAEESGWGHFQLWYWGMFGGSKPLPSKAEVVESATLYYAEHPMRTVPSVEHWLREFGPVGGSHKNLTPLAAHVLAAVELEQDALERSGGVKIKS